MHSQLRQQVWMMANNMQEQGSLPLIANDAWQTKGGRQKHTIYRALNVLLTSQLNITIRAPEGGRD